MNSNKIKANAVFEMMGRPAEHLENTMKELLKVIGNEKGIKITKSTIHELKKIEQKDKEGKPLKVPEKADLYSTFSEVDIEAESIFPLMSLCFRYMPAHIEITEPSNFDFNNLDVASIINEILAKMHNYDAIAKSAIMQNQMLAAKLKELMQNKNEKN